MSSDESTVAIYSLYHLLMLYQPENDSVIQNIIQTLGLEMNQPFHDLNGSTSLLDAVVAKKHIPLEIIVLMIRHGATRSKDNILVVQCKERKKLMLAADMVDNKEYCLYTHLQQPRLNHQSIMPFLSILNPMQFTVNDDVSNMRINGYIASNLTKEISNTAFNAI